MVKKHLITLQAGTSQSTDTSIYSLNNLNNDCLIEIFEYLNHSDLLNMAKADERFEYPCKSIVRRKGLNLNANRIDAEDALQIFGTEAKKIVIDMKMFPTKFTPGTVLTKINQYCPNVETVELINFKVTEWRGEQCFEMEVNALSPPWVKQIVIADSCVLFGDGLFQFWSKCVEFLTIRNSEFSNEIIKSISVLFKVTSLDAILFWSQNYETLEHYNIKSASFVKKL